METKRARGNQTQIQQGNLELIVRSRLFRFKGWWNINIIPSEVSESTNLSYDYLINVNGHNHVVHTDDVELLTVQDKPIDATFRIISADGTVNIIHLDGKFVDPLLSPYIADDPKEIPESDLMQHRMTQLRETGGVTELKDEQLEREAKELLESVIQSDIIALSVLRPISDDHQNIIDFEWVLANKLQKAIANGQNVIGRRYTHVFPTVIQNGSLELLKEVMLTGKRTVKESYYEDHNIRGWFRSVYVRVKDFIIISSEDITATREAELERAKNLRVLQQTEAVAGIGSWECIPADEEFTWSDGMYDLFEIPRNQQVTPGIYLDFAVDADKHIAEKIVERLTSAPAPFEEIIRIKCNNREKTVKRKAILLPGDESKPLKVLGVDFDISAQTESKYLKDLNARLKEFDLAKTEFFSNVSHEFRTPLTLMLGPLRDVLSQSANKLAPTDVQKLGMVQRNALRLQKLVNTLLDFSRVEAGKLEAFYQPTDISKLTLELAGVFRSAIESAKIKFTVRSQEIGEHVYVNREMWEKIVMNLLSNAFKFTRKGRIELLVRSRKKFVQLVVRDTGVGIARANHHLIFERFKRIESSGGRSFEGSGIGLALVKELVAMHGGTIKVKSQEGVGSEFTISIPKGKSHLPSRQIFETKEQLPGNLTSEVFTEEARGWLPELSKKLTAREKHFNEGKPVVVIADDNADMRQYLKSILSEEFNVIAYETGQKVLESLSLGSRPDLILSDVMMPEMGGYSLVTAIKSDTTYRYIPVVLLSARSAEDDKIEGISSGADDYLVKPFASRELLTLIRSRIQIAKLRKLAEASLTSENTQLEERVRERTSQFEKSQQIIARQNVQLHKILDAIPQMIWVLDSSGKISYLNDRWYNYTGLTEECIDLDTMRCDIFHPDQQAEIIQLWNESVAGKKRFTGEFLVRNKDGGFRWHLCITEPILDEQSTLEMWVGTFRDVHEQFLIEKAATESKNLIEAIVNASTNAISVLNVVGGDSNEIVDFEWSFFNKKMQKYTGRSDLKGKRLTEEYPDDRQLFEKFKEAFVTGKAVEFEYDFEGNGVVYHHQITAVKLEDSVVVTQQNITEKNEARKNLERFNTSLRQKNYELLCLNDELTNFAFIASHDLREPLRKIELFTNVLRDTELKNLSPRARDYCLKIINSVCRMNALLHDILSFSKASSTPKLPLTKFSLNHVAESVIIDLSPMITERNASVLVEELPEFWGNILQMSQLFQNLISNAIKFQNPGTIPAVRITSSFVMGSEIASSLAIPGARYLKLQFVDNGIGFEDQYAEKIFHMFQRLHNRSEFPGTGMGLAICKRVVENHDGFIIASSQVGAGSAFTCYFPANK